MHLWEEFAPELVTDLYELTMAASYLREGMNGEATFSLFIRGYPSHRAYFVSAGIEHLVDLVTGMRFSESSIEYIASTGKFPSSFIDYLRDFRFTGTMRAIPEGRIFFANEPVVEVTAPIIEGQLLETLVLNVVQLETLIASKAARCVHAARGRSLIDFSFRRTQGVDAGVKAARTSYLVGFDGTSNVLAGKLYGIPVFGTMAHSYVTSFEHELDSFLAFYRTFPENTVLLIDTYDTVSGARKAVEVARIMAADGKVLKGVRLDSGDMAALSREVRRLFRESGLEGVSILASGNLDEFKIQELIEAGAEIDVFAVGTRMGVSSDAPYLDIAYKLVEYDGRPILKLSSGKKTWVGRKQVYRLHDAQGMMKEDILSLLSERQVEGEPLLTVVVDEGKRRNPPESLSAIRERFSRDWNALPPPCREIRPTEGYPVKISRALEELDTRTVEDKRREIEGGRQT